MPFRQQQQRVIHIIETDLEINHTNIANNDPSDSSSSNNSSSSEESNGSSSDNDSNEEEDKDSEEDDKLAMASLATSIKKKLKSSSTSKQLTYQLGGMNMTFSNNSSNQNDAYNAGVVHPQASCPDVGTSAECKLISALSKNQSKSSLKDVTSLDQATS